VIYGERRVSGVIVYMSTTGHFLNQIIIWAGHPCEAIQGVYLDGRLLHPAITGYDDGGTYYDSAGNPYSFGDVVVLWNKPAGGWISQLHDVDSNWISDAKLTNLCASYIRCAYNADKFAGIPQAKATVLGKNDIYDPRTGLYGYTNNWALIIADHLCNKEWGVGCDYTKEIDETQLIAAANICDEQVLLANGLYESRYTINGAFDTARTPGDVLDTMLLAAEGKLSYSGGKWGIYPAAWRPAAFSFAADDLAGPIQWSEKRKYRDLCNAVRATYVSPVYPVLGCRYQPGHARLHDLLRRVAVYRRARIRPGRRPRILVRSEPNGRWRNQALQRSPLRVRDVVRDGAAPDEDLPAAQPAAGQRHAGDEALGLPGEGSRYDPAFVLPDDLGEQELGSPQLPLRSEDRARR
jgi:hypothetical protein